MSILFLSSSNFLWSFKLGPGHPGDLGDHAQVDAVELKLGHGATRASVHVLEVARKHEPAYVS